MKKVIVLFLLFAGLGTGGYFGWKILEEKIRDGEKSDTVIGTAQVERTSIKSTVQVSGDIGPIEEVEVKAEVTAKLAKILVRLGETVKKNQPLVKLDDRGLLTDRASAEIEIDGAKLEVEKARVEYERNKRLFEKNLIPEKDLTNSRITCQITENQLAKAQKRLQTVLDKLEKTSIVAPISGKILELPVVEGQVIVDAVSVNRGTTIMKLADLSALLIKTHVNQIDVSRLKPDMEVQFTIDSVPDTTMAGYIKAIAPIATLRNNVKGFTVDIIIHSPDPRIRPGMTANVTALVGEAKDVLAVPLSAVFTSKSGEKVVYVKSTSPETPPEARSVVIGVSDLDVVEIKSGLQGNETVLLAKPKLGQKS